MLGMFHVETKSHLVSKLIMVSFLFNSILVCWQDEKLGSESTTQLITFNNELNKMQLTCSLDRASFTE